MILQDPRNMHLSDVRKVLQHCYGLQAESGPESAFRFALFLGPRRKRLFATYPKDLEPNPRKKKDKGKRREDALQGLLRIDDSVEPPTAHHIEIEEQRNTNPSVAGPSNNGSRNVPEPAHQNGLVRIDMGQMLQLKDMGYEVSGPVNGPNEGYPEYEVPKAMLEVLIPHRQSHAPTPTPNEAEGAIEQEAANSALNSIDPALLGHDDSEQIRRQINISPDGVHMPPEANTNIGQNLQLPTNVNVNPPLSSARNVRPTTPPNSNAVVASNTKGIQKKTPKKRLGKRAQANLSPQTMHQAGRMNKKKKMTDDDRAALEAQNMVQAGSKRKSKPTQRK
jgi:hypothetical protein